MYLHYETKKGLGDQTCIYKVKESNQMTAAFMGKSPLHGGFLLPLQTAKENNSFFSPVVLVLEDVILETRDQKHGVQKHRIQGFIHV